MSGKVETREFSIDDYDAAGDLWDGVEGIEIAEGDDRKRVAKFLARNPGLSRVAVDARSRSIVGAALCGHDGRRGHIYHLAVDPKCQGLGLGKRLVDECLDGLRRAGIQRVIILVAHDNPRGREFWSRAGWEELPGAVAMGCDVKQKNSGAVFALARRAVSKQRQRSELTAKKEPRSIDTASSF